MGEKELSNEDVMPEEATEHASPELWQSPLGQSTYMFIWALSSLASFAIFFKYF